ncbi:MAG: PKD domain-containing protein, partial [Saprospiraceae bacterium]
ALNLLGIVTLSSQTLTGTVTDPLGAPVANARVTIFLVDTTRFRETRTDANGAYLFENLDPYYFFFGVAKPGFAYFENATTGIVGTVVHNAQLEPETEIGQWNVIMQSPEALGGTDLGVLMPNGSIYYCHNTKDPFFFIPTENDTSFAKGSGIAQGCVAHALLLNGKVLFAGGTLEEDGFGPASKKVKTFDPATNLWPYQPDMLDSRWYPTLAPLFDQRLLIVGGGDINTGLPNAKRTKTSEVYDPASGATQWADTVKLGTEVGAIVPLFTGKILMTHRPPQLFDPGTLQWDLAADFVQGNRMPNGDHCDHEIVMRPNGQVVAIGYKSFTPGQPGVNVEIYDPIQNTWSLGSNLAPTRSRAKVVQLPDETILVMGGFKQQATDPSPVNNWGYMGLTDQYNPNTDTWRRLANMNWKREYHAITILVPDGRVIAVGGEGAPGNEPPQSIIEAFSPPYLFKGVRPEISNFNKTVFQRGETIEFEAHKTNALTKVILMSNAVMTHFMNSGNSRCLELDFTQNGNQVSAILPNDSLKLMPGWYMLFGMVDDIPSVAQMVQILPGQYVMMETPPTAGFTTTQNSGCEPLTLQFTSTSSANTTDFNWQFPGGMPNSSTSENPTVVYSTPGTYSVTLTVSNSAGNNTATQPNYITVNPLPASGFSNSIVGATASFTNTSTNASSYLWDFGDGDTSTQISPSHIYANDGTYGVTLLSTGPCGTASATQTITIITVSTNEPSFVESFRVFPNPITSGGFLSVEIALKKAGKVNFELTDAVGKQVRNYSLLEKTIDKQVFTLKTTGIKAGVYLLTAYMENVILGTEKVIIR